MGHTYTHLLYHLIFSTKHRQPFIDGELQPRLHACLGGIVRELKGKPVIEFQQVRISSDLNCPDDAAGLDIGPQTVKAYSDEIARAKTILWNGPMGLFEDKRFADKKVWRLHRRGNRFTNLIQRKSVRGAAAAS